MQLFEKLNNYLLYILVLSITYENWDPFKLVGSYSVTYLASILYIGSSLPLLNKYFSRTILKKYFIPLFLFILAGFVSTALHSQYSIEFKDSYNYRLLLLIILSFLISCHLYSKPYLVSRVLNIYLASIVLMFLLFYSGTGTTFENGRLMIFGENPNGIGTKAMYAYMIVLGRIIENRNVFLVKLGNIILLIPFLALLISTASRGAFVSVLLGTVLFAFSGKLSFSKKLIFGTLATAGMVGFFIYVISISPVFRERLFNTIETGDIGRTLLWEGALIVISENLFIGVGFPGALPEMYKAIGRAMDPHNVFLYVLMTTGIIGFLCFFLFLLRLARNLISQYLRDGKVTYLVISAMILLYMLKAGGGIGSILLWFLFALLIGASTANVNYNEELRTNPE